MADDEVFRFAPSVDGAQSQHEDPRLALMAVCVRQQAAAGFGNYIDIRQAECPECKAPGFNTGFGVFAFACGAEVHTGDDAEWAEPCPSTICPMCDGEGQHYMAMSGETHGPRRDAERRREVMDMGKVSCGGCGGSGRRAAGPTE